MRVLVTNTGTPQAYAIIRALRPHATRIVAALEGEGPGARLAHGAWSRLVDARCRTPSLVEAWTSGRLADGASDEGAAYVDALLEIVDRERIDVVYPSWDPYVAVLARHHATFEARGVTVPVPPFETAVGALDKHRTLAIARAAGMPCPRSYLYQGDESLAAIERTESFPLVVKPRFTSGSRGMAVVRDAAELRAVLPRIVETHGPPLIQEYIPGGNRSSAQFVVDRRGAIVFAFRKERHRTFRRTARLGTVSESSPAGPHVERCRALLGALGAWGALGVETIRDPRDGLDKLMEINLRFPRQLWNRTEAGINEPLLCIRIARGEDVGPQPSCPDGTWFVAPVEDAALLALQMLDLAVHTVRTRIAHVPSLDPAAAPPGVGAQLGAFGRTYARGTTRVWDPYVSHLLSDPVPSVLWWLQYSGWIAGTLRQVGR